MLGTTLRVILSRHTSTDAELVDALAGVLRMHGFPLEYLPMLPRTAQPSPWFIADSLAQCRIYSKYLGLQIKACEVGLLPEFAAFRTL